MLCGDLIQSSQTLSSYVISIRASSGNFKEPSLRRSMEGPSCSSDEERFPSPEASRSMDTPLPPTTNSVLSCARCCSSTGHCDASSSDGYQGLPVPPNNPDDWDDAEHAFNCDSDNLQNNHSTNPMVIETLLGCLLSLQQQLAELDSENSQLKRQLSDHRELLGHVQQALLEQGHDRDETSPPVPSPPATAAGASVPSCMDDKVCMAVIEADMVTMEQPRPETSQPSHCEPEKDVRASRVPETESPLLTHAPSATAHPAAVADGPETLLTQATTATSPPTNTTCSPYRRYVSCPGMDDDTLNFSWHLPERALVEIFRAARQCAKPSNGAFPQTPAASGQTTASGYDAHDNPPMRRACTSVGCVSGQHQAQKVFSADNHGARTEGGAVSASPSSAHAVTAKDGLAFSRQIRQCQVPLYSDNQAPHAASNGAGQSCTASMHRSHRRNQPEASLNSGPSVGWLGMLQSQVLTLGQGLKLLRHAQLGFGQHAPQRCQQMHRRPQ